MIIIIIPLSHTHVSTNTHSNTGLYTYTLLLLGIKTGTKGSKALIPQCREVSVCNVELQHPSVKCWSDSETLRITSSTAEGLREEAVRQECRATAFIHNTKHSERTECFPVLLRDVWRWATVTSILQRRTCSRMLPHVRSLVYLDTGSKSNSLGHILFHTHWAFPHESVKTSKVQSPQNHPSVLRGYKKGVHIFI